MLQLTAPNLKNALPAGIAGVTPALPDNQKDSSRYKSGPLHVGNLTRPTFAVLLAETVEGGAAQVAQRIHASVCALEWQHVADQSPALTVSIGIACTASGRFETLQAFLDEAVAALHEAKNAGTNRIARGSIALQAVA